MEVRLIRAKRNIHVPHNPEHPEGNSFKAVQSGLLALVPKNFKLPHDAYEDLGMVGEKKKKA